MTDKIKIFLGKIGISPLRYKLFLTSMILIPVLILGISNYKFKKLSNQKNELEAIHLKALKTKNNRDKRSCFLNRLTSSDPLFINNNLESLLFLQDEISSLSNILQNEILKDCQSLLTRQNFLNQINRLKFQENCISNNEDNREYEVKQISQIEICLNDLLKIISLIENVKINNISPLNSAPYMVIKKFEIKKENNNNFSLSNLTITRRDTQERPSS